MLLPRRTVKKDGGEKKRSGETREEENSHKIRTIKIIDVCKK
jgi:hypothetical protein